MSSAAFMGEVPRGLGTTRGLLPLVIATKNLQSPLKKKAGDIAMTLTGHSTESQVNSALLLTTSTTCMVFPGQSTVSPSSTEAEASYLTTVNISSTVPRPDITFITKIPDIGPLCPVVTLSPEIPSRVSDKSTTEP